MLVKLFQIIFILILSVLIAILFSNPVIKLYTVYKTKCSILENKPKLTNIFAVITWYLFVFLLIIMLFLIFYISISKYFSQISWEECILRLKIRWSTLTISFPFLNYIEIERFFSTIITKLLQIPGMVGRFAVGILISFYLLLDWNHYIKIYESWRNKAINSPKGNNILFILEKAKEALTGYVKGQSLDAIVMACFISLGLWFLKVPLAIPIGILSGVGNMIPYTGPILAFSLTCLFCMLEYKMETLFYALIYLIIIQQIDGSFIGPKLLGKHLQIRPLFVIVSVFIGGTIFGVTGIIFAVPTAAALKYVILKWPER